MFPKLVTSSSTKTPTFAAANYSFAMTDPILSSMPGLFRYVDDAERARWRTSLRVSHTHGALTIEVHNSCLLGGMELAVLQALMAMAACDGDTLTPGDVHQVLVEQQLVDALVAQPGELVIRDAEQAPAITEAQPVVDDVQHVSFADTHLREVVGLPDGKPYRDMLAKALGNLATVVVLVKQTSNERVLAAYHLLSQLHTDIDSRKTHRTHIALNPRLTQFVLGNMPQDTRISLAEARKLGTNQIARILHQRLCAWVNDGSGRKVSYRTLLEYVYPNDPEQHTVDAIRRDSDRAFARLKKVDLQAQRMNEVLTELGKLVEKLGWHGEVESNKLRAIAAKLSAANDADMPALAADLSETMQELEADDDADNEHTKNRKLMAERLEHKADAADAAAAKDPLDTIVYIRRAKVFPRKLKAA